MNRGFFVLEWREQEKFMKPNHTPHFHFSYLLFPVVLATILTVVHFVLRGQELMSLR